MHFTDYSWRKGFPVGIGPCEDVNGAITYRIISDPYRKWVSIEQYKSGALDRVIYDSQLLDFRKLNPVDQVAWQKIPLRSTETETYCLIRNQDDRALVYETHYFQGDRCRECQIHSIHGVFIAVQKMSYTEFGDPYDGVTLYDSNNHPVMNKRYKTDKETGEFSELLEENWACDCDFTLFKQG